jgi:hypothetical protein
MYLNEVRGKARYESPLATLFESVLGADWTVICVDDVDVRMPVRVVLVTPDRALTNDYGTPPESLAGLLEIFGLDPDDAILARRLMGSSRLAGPSSCLAIINTSNELIADLRGYIAAASRDESSLRDFAHLLVTLARFMSQASIDADEFASLCDEILAIVHNMVRIEAKQSVLGKPAKPPRA